MQASRTTFSKLESVGCLLNTEKENHLGSCGLYLCVSEHVREKETHTEPCSARSTKRVDSCIRVIQAESRHCEDPECRW